MGLMVPSSNPFCNAVVLSRSDTLKVLLMSLFLAPVRIVLVALFMFVAFVIAFLIQCLGGPIPKDKPLGVVHRSGKDLVAWLVLMAGRMAGFWRIRVKGTPAPASEAPILALAPHSSFFDAIPYCFLGAPSVVGDVGLFPVVEKMLQLTQPILVNRNCPDSRKSTVVKIKERARRLLNESGWSQIVVFPEGACTNRRQLLVFKPGAFYPQLPVQPVCLNWSRNPDLVSWPWDGASACARNCNRGGLQASPFRLELLYLSCCQLWNELEIEFLPVHHPSEEECLDATLFAANVRARMAERLGLPTCDVSVEDLPYLISQGKPKRAQFFRLCDKLSLASENGQDGLQAAWQRLRQSSYAQTKFAVSYPQLSHFLHCPDSYPLKRLFLMFYWEFAEDIDLRELLVAQYASPGDLKCLEICCQMFAEETGELSDADLVRIFRFPSQRSVASLVALATAIRQAHREITFDSIVSFLSSNLNYCDLLVTQP